MAVGLCSRWAGSWGWMLAMASGQKRCVGRVTGLLFLALLSPLPPLSSMGCRIRRRALMNLEGKGQSSELP